MPERSRVMLYAPHLPTDQAAGTALRLAGELHRLAERDGGGPVETTVGMTARLPAALADAARCIGPCHLLPPWPGADHQAPAYASPRDFQQLTRPGAAPFDVLLLPYAWRTIPQGAAHLAPAPLVARIPHFHWADREYGIVSDHARRDLEKLLRTASAFVFPSTALRDRAVAEFGFPADRCHVILPAPDRLANDPANDPANAGDVRAAYGLPARFVLTADVLDERARGSVLLDALARLGPRLGPRLGLGLVSLGPERDEIDSLPLADTPAGAVVLAAAGSAAGSGAGGPLVRLVRLSDLPPADRRAVAAAAEAVVVLHGDTLAEVPDLVRDALAVGTPVIHAGAAAVREYPGGGRTRTVTPAPAEVAEMLAAVVSGNSPDGRTAGAAALPAPEDEARLYLELCRDVARTPLRSRPHAHTRPMVSRDERVAWLLSHTTLRDFEAPLIRSLGFEVYTCKSLPANNDFLSASVDYSDDEHSTLPTWVLDVLNRFNFYEQKFTPEVVELLNAYFGTIICANFFEVTHELVKHFRGRILVRVFGREHPQTYSHYFNASGGPDFWRQVWQIQHRFWLAPCYDTIPGVEKPLLRDRSVLLPLGMPERVYRFRDDWVGGDPRILFVCPRIASHAFYYGKIFEEFKAAFDDLPFVVAGHQPKPVADPRVLEWLSESAYQRLFRDCRVMFYHSREPRHLHYHPLEAVVHGMPLIYMRGGLLEQFGGAHQPGACATLEEARAKVLRVLQGDEGFIRELRQAQQALLEPFSWEYNRRVWQENFVGRVIATPPAPDLLTPADWGAGRAAETAHLLPAPPRPRPAPSPVPAREPARPPVAETPLHRTAVDLMTSTGGGVHKFGVHLVRALLEATRPESWRCRLRLRQIAPGLEPPSWPLAQPEHLALEAIPVPPSRGPTLGGRMLQAAIHRLCTTAEESPRPVRRLLAKLAVCPLLYGRAAWRQRTLLPRGSGVMPYVPYRLRTSRAFGGLRAAGRTVWRRFRPAPCFYEAPPPPPGYPPFPREQPRPLWSLADVDRALHGHDSLLVLYPFWLLDPNIPLDEVAERPVAVVLYDLAHEYTDSWNSRAEAVSREMRLWGRLARVIVFCSEFVRDESVRRYGIPAHKTRVIHMPPFLAEQPRPGAARRRAAAARYGLPDTYVLNLGWQGSHKNNLALFRAYELLRFRGCPVPPLVLAGKKARELLLGETIGGYFEACRQAFRDSPLKLDRDYFILDMIAEEDVPALYAGASVCVSLSRSEASLNGLIMESMFYGTPVVASHIPQVVERLGDEGRYALLVPPDDHVAAADAIQQTLEFPEETRRRVERAGAFIRAHTWDMAARQYLDALRDAAGGAVGGADTVPLLAGPAPVRRAV